MVNEYFEELKELELIFKLMVKKEVDISEILNSSNNLCYNEYCFYNHCLNEEEFSKIKRTILNYKEMI